MIFRITILFLVSLSVLHAQVDRSAPRENLGPAINSPSDEVLPLISPDGTILFFDRKDHPGNIGGRRDDIWFSRRGADGTWQEAINIGPPLNNEGYNYVCSVLPDNNTLLLGNVYHADGSMDQGVSIAVRTRDGWSVPRALSIERYRNDHPRKLAEYSLSPDGRVLVMSIQTPTSYGERDLYVSFLQGDSIWTEPENMGPDINSSGTDVTPFIAADGRTVYFSSNRAGGFGSNDIYVSRREGEGWTRWTTPQNLDAPVNTPGWDGYFSIPVIGHYAYFVSTPGGSGNSDIFRIRMPEAMIPRPVMLVRGTVRDSAGHPITGAILRYERLSDGVILGQANIDPATGAFQIALPSGDEYAFRAMAPNHVDVSDHLDTRSLRVSEERERHLVLAPLRRGTTARLNNIFFDFNKASIRPESTQELLRLAELCRANPQIRLHIVGHTDNVGDAAYNLALSRSRAQAVVDHLVGLGIAAERLTADGKGDHEPVMPNTTEEGRQTNRRVEFTLH